MKKICEITTGRQSLSALRAVTKIALLVCWFGLGCRQDEPLKECPFKTLPAVTELAVMKEKQLKFASEIDTRIALLRNKINAGIKPSMLVEYGETIDRYQRDVLCPDPAFVGYYNAFQNIVCGKWELYHNKPTEQTKQAFDTALADLQSFIKEYYQQGQMKNYRDAFEFIGLDDSFSAIKRDIESLEARYPDEISKILLESYREKIKVIKQKTAQIQLEKISSKSFDDVKTLQNELHNLRRELRNFNNNQSF